jgi:hypothetical protein
MSACCIAQTPEGRQAAAAGEHYLLEEGLANVSARRFNSSMECISVYLWLQLATGALHSVLIM